MIIVQIKTTGGKTWSVLAELFKLVGRLLSGLLTWLGAIMFIIVMIDAIFTVHGKNGYPKEDLNIAFL